MVHNTILCDGLRPNGGDHAHARVTLFHSNSFLENAHYDSISLLIKLAKLIFILIIYPYVMIICGRAYRKY